MVIGSALQVVGVQVPKLLMFYGISGVLKNKTTMYIEPNWKLWPQNRDTNWTLNFTMRGQEIVNL